MLYDFVGGPLHGQMIDTKGHKQWITRTRDRPLQSVYAVKFPLDPNPVATACETFTTHVYDRLFRDGEPIYSYGYKGTL